MNSSMNSTISYEALLYTASDTKPTTPRSRLSADTRDYLNMIAYAYGIMMHRATAEIHQSH